MVNEPVRFAYFNGVLACHSDAGLRWQCSCKTWNAWGSACCVCRQSLPGLSVPSVELDAIDASLRGSAA